MHLADSLISPVVAGTMYVASGLMTAYSIHKLRKEDDLKRKIPTMGVMGAFVFATQMINFTIPGTGASGHLCGGLLLTSILGPYAGFLSMIGVLLIQCLFFADGGLLSLGANIWNMAFYGCFLGSLIWKVFTNKNISKKKIIASSLIGSVLALQLGAFSVTIETLLSGITELPFKTFISLMLPIHLIIGIVEGLITSAVLCFIYDARPELLWNPNNTEHKANKMSYKKLILILSCLLIIIGGAVSLIASSNPDGLEWSIQKITGETELDEKEDDIYQKANKIQESTAILPDYSLKNNETQVGTSISGIVGCIITFGVLFGVGYIIKLSRKKEKVNEQN